MTSVAVSISMYGMENGISLYHRNKHGASGGMNIVANSNGKIK